VELGRFLQSRPYLLAVAGVPMRPAVVRHPVPFPVPQAIRLSTAISYRI
jgi:hypothetical protein